MLPITAIVSFATVVASVNAQGQTIGAIVKGLASTQSSNKYQEYAYTLAKGGAAYDSTWDAPGTHVLFIPSDRAYDQNDAPTGAVRTQYAKVTAPAGVLFETNHKGEVSPDKTTHEVNYAFFFKDDKNRTAIGYDDFNHGGTMASNSKNVFGCLGQIDGRQLHYWTGVEADSNLKNSCCAVDVIDASNGVIFVTECPILTPPSWQDVLDANGQSLFKAAIIKSGLDKLLDAQPKGQLGRYTLFGLTDSVVSSLNLDSLTDAQLKAFIGNHIVDGYYPALAQYYGATSATSLLGEKITLGGSFDYTSEGGGKATSDYPWDLSGSGAHVLWVSSGSLTPSAKNKDGSDALNAALGLSPSTTTAAPSGGVNTASVSPSATSQPAASTKPSGAMEVVAGVFSFVAAGLASLLVL
ncbi:hypothetical protein HDU97_006260 [Phlyctochytrium planicorne]|nr:hypothetical protein HDU97_006260 [Phlyctochytrium planicorne]